MVFISCSARVFMLVEDGPNFTTTCFRTMQASLSFLSALSDTLDRHSVTPIRETGDVVAAERAPDFQTQ